MYEIGDKEFLTIILINVEVTNIINKALKMLFIENLIF